MVRVYLNNGTLYKFKKVRPNFADGNIYIPYDDIVYKEELKNIYKVVKKIKGYDKLEQVLKLMKAEGKTKDDEAFKIIVDLLY